METRWIKRISFILAAAMLLTLLPVSALAEEASPSQNTPAPIIDTPADTPAEEHVVALTAADGGRVSGGGVYVDGEEVTVTAHPSDDYEFTGWYDDARLISIAPVYTFTASQSVSYQAAFSVAAETTFALTVGGTEKYTVTDKDGKELAASAIPANTAVTLTYTGTEGTFLYWVNGSGNILSTDSVYTFTMVRDATIAAKYTESAPTVSRVVFRNGYAQIMSDFTNGNVSLPAGPTKMGYTFDYWYYVKDGEPKTLNESDLDKFNEGLSTDPATRIEVLPFYSENGAKYTINISYQNADGDELETQPDPKTQTVKVGVKTNTGAAPETIGDLTFSYWKDGDSGKKVSYDRNYSVLRAQSCTVNLVAVYGDTTENSTPKPIANIIQTYASKSGEKYVVSNTMQYYLPENYELVQAGIEYYTSTNETVRRSVDSNTTRRGLFTFNARLSNPATKLNAKGFIIYKDKAGVVQDPQYSDLVSKSYYDLSGTASVKKNDQGTFTVAPATIQTPAASEDNTPEVTAIIPEGVMLEQKLGENAAAAPVSLTIAVAKEPVPENVDIPSAAQQTTNFQVEIQGVASDNNHPIVVCLKKALAAKLTGVKAYHINAQNNQPEEMKAGESATLTEPETFFYDAKTGDLYICVNHFSDFTFTYDSSLIKFPNVDKYLYRVGNQNAINLSSLFDTTNVSVKSLACEALSATIDNVATITGVTSIEFDDAFTGVVRLTATLTNGDTITLPLEVVEAKNIIAAENAENNSVCLLNDCSVGNTSIKVKNGYSFYGNGFTVTSTDNGQAKDGQGLDYGYFSVNGGTLDNLTIACAIYPKAYLYVGQNVINEYVTESSNLGYTNPNNGNKYYKYQYSGVTVTQGGVISNCYIKGARNNILVTGSATITNTTCDRGSLSNIQITGTDENTVILNNCTTIQYVCEDSFGVGNKVEGLGILIGTESSASNPRTVIMGSLNQFNWVCSEDEVTSSKVAKRIIDTALDQPKYIHHSDGKEYVNMGIMFMNTRPSNIQDMRTSETYELSQISLMTGVNGQVYSLPANEGIVQRKDNSYCFTDAYNAAYTPVYKVKNLFTTAPDENAPSYCWYDGDSVQIKFPLGGTYDFDVNNCIDFGRYTGENPTVTISCAGATVDNGVVRFSTSGSKTIIIEVSDTPVYDAKGVYSQSHSYTLRIPVNVLTPDVSWPPAEIEIDNSTASGFYYDSNGWLWTDLLEGITITDYTRDGNPVTVLDASHKTSFTKSIAKFTYENTGDTASPPTMWGSSYRNTVTFELTDGRKLEVKLTMEASSTPGKSGRLGQIMVNNANNPSSVYLKGTGNTNSSNINAEFYGKSRLISCSFIGYNGERTQQTGDNTNPLRTAKNTGTNYSGSKPNTSFSPTITKTIHFDPRGGNCGQSVAYITSTQATTTLPTPIKQGLDFKGWFTAPVGGTRIGGAGDTVKPNNDTMPGTDVTLYAQWIAPFTVTYRVNGGTALDQDTFVCVSGSDIQLPTTSQTTQWFTGWYVGEERIGGAGDTYYVPEHDVTIIAGWSPKYAVAYDANGGTLDDAYSIANPLENNQVFVGAIYEGNELVLPLPTNGTRTFEGWFTEKTEGTRIGDAGDGYIPEESITLHAQWSDNIPVTYCYCNPEETTEKVKYDNVTPLTLPSPTWDGHQFNGWYTATSGGTKKGDGGASYTPTEPITLYAQWTAYTVSFDGNGATNPNPLSAGSNGSVTLPTPTKTGHSCTGWCTEGGYEVGIPGASYTPTANITLYAQWTVNTHTITLSISNATGSVTYGGTTINTDNSTIKNVPYGATVNVTLSNYKQSDSKTFKYTYGNQSVTLNSNNKGTDSFTMPDADVKVTMSSTSCLPSGTLITMADGTQKPIEAITMDDTVLAFNHETGAFSPASIIFLEDDGEAQYNVVNLTFSDGTLTRLIYEHGYFDLDLMQYVYITEDNCADFVGHRFAKTALGDTGYEFEPVTLTDAYVTQETTGCYSFPTVYHLNVIADGMLSMPGGIEGMFNIFTYDEDLKYDADAMARDIETYGLLTYDDFADVMSYEEYALYPAPYLSVSMGKGLMTPEQLAYLIERYIAAKR